jgi:hypothetical protein
MPPHHCFQFGSGSEAFPLGTEKKNSGLDWLRVHWNWLRVHWCHIQMVIHKIIRHRCAFCSLSCVWHLAIAPGHHTSEKMSYQKTKHKTKKNRYYQSPKSHWCSEQKQHRILCSNASVYLQQRNPWCSRLKLGSKISWQWQWQRQWQWQSASLLSLLPPHSNPHTPGIDIGGYLSTCVRICVCVCIRKYKTRQKHADRQMQRQCKWKKIKNIHAP